MHRRGTVPVVAALTLVRFLKTYRGCESSVEFRSVGDSQTASVRRGFTSNTYWTSPRISSKYPNSILNIPD
ncbi:hypothetical protein C8039_12230 [Halogeometricum sp. wsp3]|nr:hypothetical protein C8039_12230 [Halogeometricum sp. wsp3]